MKPFYIKLFSIIIISCLGFLVYSNAFICSFHFDDYNYIVDNFYIRNIQNLLNIWKFCPCRFTAFLSIAINYHFHQVNVFGYHLFNLAIHLVSAILVWWLTLLTFSTPTMKENKITQHANLIALFVGLVFVSHPVQIQAVTYIWQRAASMAALFYLASLSFYVKSRLLQADEPSAGLGRFYYIFSLITAIVAMFTKENTITLPLVILLYEFIFFEAKKGLNWRHISPFLFTIFIIPLTMLLTKSARFQEIHDVTTGPEGISPLHYFLTQFRVMATYIRLVFLPFNQNMDYDYPIFKNIFELPVLTSLFFLITILYSAKRLFSKHRLVSFSIFWFFLTLLPESSFLPLKDVIFEHRLYLPLVGYSMFLVSGVYYLFGKNSIKTMVIVLTMIITFNSILTFQRNKVWKDEITLWDDTVRKSPHKARPYNYRGLAYYNRGGFAQVMFDYNKAIELNPNYTDAYNNRGIFYIHQGNFVRAISNFAQAIEIDPNYAQAYCNRGVSYTKQGNAAKAIPDYNKAIEINPDYVDAYNNRGIFYVHQGNFVQAMSDFAQAIDIDPGYAKAYYNRGLIYAKQGRSTQAISDYNKAIELNPDYLDAYYNRGLELGRQKKFTQALADYNKDLEINPNDAQAYNNRAFVYYQLRNYDKSWEDVHKAEKLGVHVNPGFISELKQASGR